MPQRELSHIERLRAAIAVRVNSTSLRGTAREIGMSAPGLQAFLNGTTPHPSTIRKVERWFLRQVESDELDMCLTGADIALRLLLQDLPTSIRAAGMARTVNYLEALYDEEGIPRPAWLLALRGEID